MTWARIITLLIFLLVFLLTVCNWCGTRLQRDGLEKRVANLEKKLDGTTLHKEIELYYLNLICEKCEEYTKEAVENAMRSPIELTHEEIEKAFGHRVRIVSEKKG